MSSQIEDAFNGAMERRASGYEQRIAALDDLVQRAWSLIAGAMSGNPHKPTANSDWMDAAHAWEIDYCMGQGSSVPEYPTVSYRVRDRDSDYKAMCHEDRDHAELLLKAWLADGRDAVIERRHVFDGGWLPVGRPFFTEQQERNLARCEAFDRASEPRPENPYRTVHARMSPPGAAWDEGFASRQPEIDRLEAERDEARLETWRIVHKCPSCDRYFDSPSICSDGTYTVEQLERVPDGTWPDQSAQHGVLLDQIKDAYAEGIADTIDRLRVRAAEMLPEVARFTLDEIEVAAADLLASSTAEKLASPRKHSASASDPMPLCDCEWCARPLRDHDEEESG